MREAALPSECAKKDLVHLEEKLNFIWGEGGEGLSEMKLTIEEGPNGPMKETSRGTEVRGREGGYIGGW